MSDYWIEVEGIPRAATLDEWMAWTSPENKRVAKTTVGPAWVSTVFLGLDHAYGGGPPVLYETMIFEGKHDGYCWRYTSREAALQGHARIVGCLESGTDPDADEGDEA